MNKYIISLPIFALASVGLLTASQGSCPNCAVLDCSIVGSTLEISGGAIPLPGASDAVFEVVSGNPVCEYDVDTGDFTVQPSTAEWSADLSHNAACGTDLTDARLWIDFGAGLEEYGACS